jgi:dCMP deaminase
MKNISKWNYFMSSAMLSARRSKDPSTKCGATIVSPEGRIIGQGYNGFPNGCKDAFSWHREGKFLDSKYAFVVHAELNAILNATAAMTGSDMFCTLHPCNECAKAIVQAGIKLVVYWSDKYHDTDSAHAARLIFEAAKVETARYQAEKLNILNIEGAHKAIF